jgi:hypothetical protein
VTEVADPFFTARKFGQGLAVLSHGGFLILPLFMSLDLGSRDGVRSGLVLSAVLSLLAAILGGLIVGGWRKAAYNIVLGCFAGFGMVTVVFGFAFLQVGFPHSTNIASKIFSVSITVALLSVVLLALGRRKRFWIHDAI